MKIYVNLETLEATIDPLTAFEWYCEWEDVDVAAEFGLPDEEQGCDYEEEILEEIENDNSDIIKCCEIGDNELKTFLLQQ